MTVESACAMCKVKSICGMSEQENKIVSVATDYPEAFSMDEEVMISVSKGMGMKAVTLAYIVPFFVLLGSLLVMTETGVSEATAGLTALGVTAVYYLFLYIFRNKIEREIIFKIHKI
jgi:sigma-E factor negative regulatory protein RseC